MAGRNASAGRALSVALGVVSLIFAWGSFCSGDIVITAQTPDTFTASCTGLEFGNKGTVTINYGQFSLSAAGRNTLTFAVNSALQDVNCQFKYALQGAPVHKSVTIFSVSAPCAKSACEWVVKQDGFYSQDAVTGALTFIYGWDAGSDASSQ